jgi:outer membrane protein OmpA-like peptidoglycan-associated protein
VRSIFSTLGGLSLLVTVCHAGSVPRNHAEDGRAAVGAVIVTPSVKSPTFVDGQPAAGHDTLVTVNALFAFDKYSMTDIKPEGQKQLDLLAQRILMANDRIDSIHVRGYSDRMGDDSYDGELSERRAYTVMNYLVQRGVPFRMIVAEGRGKDAPVKTGCDSTDRSVLIACLAPNRRVWVGVEMKSVG